MHRCASVRPRGALLLEAPAAQGTVKRLNDAKGFGFVHQDDGGLQVSRIYGTHGNIAFDSNGLWALVLGRRKRLRIPELLDIMGYRGMLREFLASVREGRELRMSPAVAGRDMEVVFAAYRSLSSGKFEPAVA